jgi:hypothetical protein
MDAPQVLSLYSFEKRHLNVWLVWCAGQSLPGATMQCEDAVL